jgi:hypothetical protein
MMQKLYGKLYKSNILTICSLSILLALLISLSFAVLDAFLFDDGTEKYDGHTLSIAYVLSAVVFAPLIETLLFQYGPLKLGHLLFKKYKYHYVIIIFIILLSSFIFGSLHSRFRVYPFVAFCHGMVLASCCFLFDRKKQHPFLYTAITHACYNALLVLVTFLLTYFQIGL